MATIFISHSKKDRELVEAIAKMLRNVGQTPIIEEYIPKDAKEVVPYEEIRKNVEFSDYIFLFLTESVTMTEYTKNWVIFEVGLTARDKKRLFVFTRKGDTINFPIPYVTDFMLFDPKDPRDILDIQKLAKDISKLHPGIPGGIIGAILGAPFGPAGLVIGVLAGGAIGASTAEAPKKITCSRCNVTFNYYSDIRNFPCPCCLYTISL